MIRGTLFVHLCISFSLFVSSVDFGLESCFFYVFHSVQKPREQVADAEALFVITNTLVTSVKAYGNEGVTPSDFVSCLLRDFRQEVGPNSSQNEARSLIRWKDIGQVVSHVFRSAPGCCTM